jgi:hypothetical protein
VSFLITVAVPLPDNFSDNVEELKSDGMTYVPERKCWVGEVGDDYAGVATIVGTFVCEMEECPFPKSWSKDKLLKRIDQSCDFKLVGR